MEFLLTKRQVNLVDFDSMWGNTQTKQGIPKRAAVCLLLLLLLLLPLLLLLSLVLRPHQTKRN